MLLFFKIFSARQSAIAAAARETVPPEVYPAGMVTVPALVEMVPLVDPLSAIDPETDPEEPKAVFPVKRSPAATFAPVVS